MDRRIDHTRKGDEPFEFASLKDEFASLKDVDARGQGSGGVGFFAGHPFGDA